MPTYKNNLNHQVIFNSVVFSPGETKSVLFNVPSALGLDKVSDVPAVTAKKVVFSEKYNFSAFEDDVITLNGNGFSFFSVSVVCTDGDLELRFGTDTYSVYLEKGMVYNGTFNILDCDTIYLMSESGAKFIVTIEKA